MHEPFEKIQQFESVNSKISICVFFQKLGLFMLSDSRNVMDIRVYDSEKLIESEIDEKKTFKQISCNLGTTLKDSNVKGIKFLDGGSAKRMLCVIEHDDSLQTICEYKLASPNERDWLVFSQVVTLDNDYILAALSLINGDKILVQNSQTEKHYILNIDMKAYWAIDPQLQTLIDNVDEPKSLNFIPESCLDGFVARTNYNL